MIPIKCPSNSISIFHNQIIVMHRYLFLLLLLFGAIHTTSAEERPLPLTWWALANSVNSEDLGIVKNLRSLKWFDACAEWGRGIRSSKITRQNSALQLMLKHDNALNETDLENAKNQSIAIGMSTCGVIAALGKPESSNSTTTATSTSVQMVYRKKRIYVYTEAPANSGYGIVRSFQQ